MAKESSCTAGVYLYVSQQIRNGIACVLAIVATIAVPARDETAPFACSEWAPTKTFDTCDMTDPRAGRRQ